jgi:Methyltransferase domain
MSMGKIAGFLADRARKLAYSVARRTFGNKIIFIDYPVNPIPRWGYSHPHQELHNIINSNRNSYAEHLRSFLDFTENLARIPKKASGCSPSEPNWMNGWIPPLDAVALYSLIAIKQPKYFLEVGSGNSTKFARKAITDHRLDTKIISIDPHPRVEIDTLCDQVIRTPVEAVSLDLFDRLGSGDILYVDNSHRVFMNSDTTAIFLDVLPRLKPGVLVEIHDVTLPFDYPNGVIDRYYSEQYLLAAYLLARGHRFDIILPNAFIDSDNGLRSILMPVWQKAEMQDVETYGCSFWIQMN